MVLLVISGFLGITQQSKEYLELKKGAEGYLSLKSIHEATEKDLKAARSELSNGTTENEALRSSQQNRWFLSGALVLLSGLLIGGIAGRSKGKGDPSIHKMYLLVFDRRKVERTP